jgi:hypothetical protein
MNTSVKWRRRRTDTARALSIYLFIYLYIYGLFNNAVRARAHQGNWQPQRNRNLREQISAWVVHMLLNAVAQLEETATQFALLQNF